MAAGTTAAIGAALAGATILGLAPWAHADATEHMFYERLAAHGIWTFEPQSYKAALQLCSGLANGRTAGEVVEQAQADLVLDREKASWFAGIAHEMFCASVPVHIWPAPRPVPVAPPQPSTATAPGQEPEWYGDEPWGPGEEFT